MSRPALEIADIFRRHGAAWRAAHAGHVSLGQLKVMSAIETCRTAALGGHVEACEGCRHTRVAAVQPAMSTGSPARRGARNGGGGDRVSSRR